MLQQTRVEAVKGYYARFLAALPSIEALANAAPDALHKLWEGLGYYSRVRNLQAAAQKIVSEYGGVFPRSYDEVLALPGIGPYTAGAICSIAFYLPTPAVDGNVLRVVTRLLACSDSIDLPMWGTMWSFSDSIDDECTRREVRDALAAVYPPESGAFTQSLMELGATVCTPNGAPKCEICPLRGLCRGMDAWERYPVRGEKKPRRIEDRTVFVLRCGEDEAVCKRPSRGLLASLWEYPNVDGSLNAEEALAQAEAWGCEPGQLLMQLDRVHIFTHVQWNLRCYYITCREEPARFTWVSPERMDREIALPTAFRMFLRRDSQ